VTVSDPDGLSASEQAEIVISRDLPPTLFVEVVPETEGAVILTVDDALNLSIIANDPEGGALSKVVNWGDGNTGPALVSQVSHTYETAGIYYVLVTVEDRMGQTTSWQMSVEVVEELTETEIYTYFGEQLPADDAVENELDADADGNVDEAEDAEEENGYDWEGDFDGDSDGEYDHDNGNIGIWVTKNDEDVEDVAESDDTNGSSRSSKESSDPLFDDNAHVTENETDHELDDETGLTEDNEVMEEVFDDTEDELESADDDPALSAEYYEDLINGTHAIWWNETFDEDLDGDGVNETTCHRSTAVVWVDADHDGNPERAIMYRARYCTADRDGDGVDDLTLFEVEALNATDINDNGTPEIVEALHLIVITWTNGSTVDTNTYIIGAAAVDIDEDGNLERVLVAVAHGRGVDLTGDGINEFETLEYAIIAAADYNDDGTPEEALALILETINIDLDGDGNVNHTVTAVRIVHALDSNSDGSVDDLRAAQFGEEKFDNNSDGTIDTSTGYWLGVRIVDRNFDGAPDKISMAQGYEHEDDSDGDGNSETHTLWFVASTVKDLDADGNPEHIWVFVHGVQSTDSDDDGNLDWRNETLAGAEARDWNDDGNTDYYVGVRIYVIKASEHANGWVGQGVFIWILKVWDINSDGNWNVVHAVAHDNVTYDNNSDGIADTYRTNVYVWHGIDLNGNGHYERQVYVFFTMRQIDDNADGNLEATQFASLIHSRNSTLNGVTHEWYIWNSVIQYNVSSSGIAQITNQTTVGYETWNTSQRQETHAVVYMNQENDDDRDGTTDSQTTYYVDNRS
jgi:hypothetical protein